LNLRIEFGVAKDERLELPMFGATFAHDHLVVTQEDVRVDQLLALRADATGELVEDFRAVYFLGGEGEGHGG